MVIIKMGVNCIVFAEIKRAFKSSKKLWFLAELFCCWWFRAKSKIAATKNFLLISIYRSQQKLYCWEKSRCPQSTKYHPPPKKNIHTQKHTHTQTHTHTHTHTHTQSCMRGGRSKWLGGGGRNIMCCAHYHDSPCYLIWSTSNQNYLRTACWLAILNGV